jgi:hypothetical protein
MRSRNVHITQTACGPPPMEASEGVLLRLMGNITEMNTSSNVSPSTSTRILE